MRFVELFAGIGGFSVGFEKAGMECAGHVEIEKYAQKVLLKHWPNVPLLPDVKEVIGDEFGKVDVLCGGFPCQDLSVAGKQKGIHGERSGLYDEVIRIAGVCRPRFIVLENVANLLSRTDWFGYVLGRLAEIGYDAEWEIVRASDLGAPHRRARVWIVAYPRHLCGGYALGGDEQLHSGSQIEKAFGDASQSTTSGSGKEPEVVADTNEKGLQGRKIIQEPGKIWEGAEKQFERFSESCGRENWASEPGMGRVVDGVPKRMDRLKCLGNALVPQIAEFIGQRIMEIDGNKTTN